MFKNTILILVLSLFCNCIVGQLRFIEKEEGIKKIETYKYVGDIKRTKKLDFTQYYNADGTLQKAEYSWATINYYYEDEKIIEVTERLNEGNCKSAYEYIIVRDSNELIIRKYLHEGKYKPTNPCNIYAIEPDGRAKADHLFEDVKLQLKDDPSVEGIYIYEYTQTESTDEYNYYYYTKTRNAGTYNLYGINTVSSDGGDGFMHRNFFVFNYGDSKIRLSQQQIKDKHGFQLDYLTERELVEPTGKIYDKCMYKYDDKNNWISQDLKYEGKTKLIKERVIEYH